MSYQAAEQAYAEHRFAEAQELLAEHLSQAPNDLRGLLLQGYIAFFGFEQPEQAAISYKRVLELCTEGPYRELAEEGLQQCPKAQAAPTHTASEARAAAPVAPSQEPPPATPWLQPNAASTKAAAEEAPIRTSEPEASTPEASQPAPSATPEPVAIEPAGYEAAEQAYQQRDFSLALELLKGLLARDPEDLRALLLRGYVQMFGFQNEAAAIDSYEQVLALCPEGPYRDLAEQGLGQCGINRHAPDEPVESNATNPEATWLEANADLALQPEPNAEAELASARALQNKNPTNSLRPLKEGWLLVDLSAGA